MLKTLNQIFNIVGIIAIAIVIFSLSSNRVKYIKDSEVIVQREFYDSLVAIANRPPTIQIDTIRDTITLPKEIEYITKPIEIQPTDIDSIGVSVDTLSSRYFDIFITDTIISNKVMWRAWNYKVYQETIIEYIEKEKPVIKYEYIDASGFYQDIMIAGFRGGGMAAYGIAYHTKKDFILGVNVGVFGLIEEKDYRPYIGVRISKKF